MKEITCKTCKLENLGHIDFLRDINKSLHPKCLECKGYYCTDELVIFSMHKECYDFRVIRNAEAEAIKIR